MTETGHGAVEHEGPRLMGVEMARQCGDAGATLDDVKDTALTVAEHVRANSRAVLYGMGGSLHVNRVAEPLCRGRGLGSRGIPASEALLSPLLDGKRTALIASRSGEPGGIVGLVPWQAGNQKRSR